MEQRRLAARRLRALAHRCGAPARVLPADRLGRRRPLRGALLSPLLARLRRQPRVAVPARPGHRRRRGRSRQPTCSRQDLIYVGGGNVVSMLGAWRAHGLDAVLRRAWRKGIVLCGPSAGSLCWFERGAQRLPRRAPDASAGSACCRTPTASTTTPSPRAAPSTTASSPTACAPAIAVEDGVALHFRAHAAWSGSSARAPTAAPTASSRPRRRRARRALETRLPRGATTPTQATPSAPALRTRTEAAVRPPRDRRRRRRRRVRARRAPHASRGRRGERDASTSER